jgi:uncharacterized membrane protein
VGTAQQPATAFDLGNLGSLFCRPHGFGIWKKVRAIRIAAFVLFGMSILKIFIYDLSFLEMLYRIFSFIALGIVLLAVSYAYQRFRHVIFGVKSPTTPDKV